MLHGIPADLTLAEGRHGMFVLRLLEAGHGRDCLLLACRTPAGRMGAATNQVAEEGARILRNG
jgi:hypothetical protein